MGAGAFAPRAQTYYQQNPMTLDQVLAGDHGGQAARESMPSLVESGQITDHQANQIMSAMYPKGSVLEDVLNIVKLVSTFYGGANLLGGLLSSAGMGAAAGATGGAGASAGTALNAAKGASNFLSGAAPSVPGLTITPGTSGLISGLTNLGAASAGFVPVEGVNVTGRPADSSTPGAETITGLTPEGVVSDEITVTADRLPRDTVNPMDLVNIGGNAVKTPSNEGSPGNKFRMPDMGSKPIASGGAGRPVATAAGAPVMASASPFGGGGAGVGPPLGGVKGSTAPNIFPWKQP